METQAQRVARVLREEVAVEPYNPDWPGWFQAEVGRLRRVLPACWLGRIEHFGSTAVPGLAAKPVVDMLVEVRSVEQAGREAPALLRPPRYDFFWRPTWGETGEPFYPWFIRRDGRGRRTHHIHMVEPDFEHWGRLRFRDALRAEPDLAAAYAELKLDLARRHRHDRVAYTRAKTDFIHSVMDALP